LTESVKLHEIFTDQIKGLAIIFVLLGHLRSWFHIENIIPKIFSASGAWGVTIFLVLSGYGLTQSYLGKGLTLGSIKRRLVRVLLPYSVVSVLWLLIDYIHFHKVYSFPSIFTTLIGLNIFKPELDPTMWFITYLLMWYIVFYLIFLLPLHKSIKVLTIFVFASVLQYKNMFLVLDWKYNYFAFPLGVLISYFNIIFFRYRVVFVLNNLSIFIFCIFLNKINDLSNFMSISLTGISIAFWLITIFPAINLKSNFLRFMGSISYEIYLFEGALALKYSQTLIVFKNPTESLLFFLILVLACALVLKKTLNFIITHIRKFFLKMERPSKHEYGSHNT